MLSSDEPPRPAMPDDIEQYFDLFGSIDIVDVTWRHDRSYGVASFHGIFLSDFGSFRPAGGCAPGPGTSPSPRSGEQGGQGFRDEALRICQDSPDHLCHRRNLFDQRLSLPGHHSPPSSSPFCNTLRRPRSPEARCAISAKVAPSRAESSAISCDQPFSR
ncbi:hypothetical protein ACIG56_00570 [Nocardia fusca]|uniref:hypothetical protein n=1 Tax=Nocardia fusca TaxID=941183 RepID=UPI0037C75C50